MKPWLTRAAEIGTIIGVAILVWDRFGLSKRLPGLAVPDIGRATLEAVAIVLFGFAIFVGLLRLRRLESAIRSPETDMGLRRIVSDLETRLLALINTTGSTLNDRIRDLRREWEQGREEQKGRLEKLERVRGDSFPALTESGDIRRVTDADIDELMEKNPDAYMKLKELNPNLDRWREDALEKPREKSPDTIAPGASKDQLKKRSATGRLFYTGYGPDRKTHTYNRLEVDQLTLAEREKLFADFPDMRGWYYDDD